MIQRSDKSLLLSAVGSTIIIPELAHVDPYSNKRVLLREGSQALREANTRFTATQVEEELD
eukprot:13360133-Alexandrium_andersonii.AAC.1